MSELRSLPSVDALLHTQPFSALLEAYGRALVVEAVRGALEDARLAYAQGAPIPEEAQLVQRAAQVLEEWTKPTLLPVINASGVIIHTNLGRAPLSCAARQAVEEAGRAYSTLEFDLASGQRGSRLIHAESLLKRLSGAEAALVVNNNAAALLLALSALARRRRVVIARSQLVEIGGGFRVPDVMRQSGASLVEIGATNRVHLADYEEALQESTALVLRAHRSNFKIVGFTEEPPLSAIVQAAHARGVGVLDDLGSGSLLDTALYGLEHEPMVQESLAAGVDLVCFSGDKLLGGPQAGIVLGRAELVAKLQKHPLARAVRADKLCLAGLTATLLHYVKGEAVREIPIWRMIGEAPEEIQLRASAWQKALQSGAVEVGRSTVGGGSLPGESLPTWVLSLPVKHSKAFLARLRAAQPPVIARVEGNRVLLDPRTVLPEQEAHLLRAVADALGNNG